MPFQKAPGRGTPGPGEPLRVGDHTVSTMGARVRARRTTLLKGIIATALVAALAGSSTAATPGIPARVGDFGGANIEERSYPVLDAAGNADGSATWRVVGGTGNCCENYLAASRDGRLYDFGGTYLRFTKDEGRKWTEVRPLEPLLSGEGALSVAPNGDVIGMTWDPYSGDHILTFKYEVETESWIYSETKLHAPFFDRPWLAVATGPFEIDGQSFPYVSILMSNFAPHRDIWYVSVDGLNYVVPSARTVDAITEAADAGKLKLSPDPAADWNQPQTQSGVTPISGGGALASDMGAFDAGVPRYILKAPKLRWARVGKLSIPKGRLQIDSRGWLHHVHAPEGEGSFVYSISTDGGETWKRSPVKLPAGHATEDFDFRANGKLGITALAIHARNKPEKTDQDLLYKFSSTRPKPKLERVYLVGDGDQDIGRGISSSIRFDFPTVAILPNGTIALSFADKAHSSPAIALLLGE